MRLNMKAKNTQVTEALTEYAEKRFSKLDKYFNGDVEGTLTLIVEKEIQKAEATISLHKYILRAEAKDRDMYAAIDAIVDKLERQVHKYKTKINRKGNAQLVQPVEDAPVVAETEEKIIKTKSFVVRPMDEEEAIMQMELLGHSFFVFLNAETNEINVVYKRADEQYGLIQPKVE